MSEERANLFRNIRQVHQEANSINNQRSRLTDPQRNMPPQQERAAQSSKPSPTRPSSSPKRGRPATGKRSNPDWIGRTYYVKRNTDLDVEGALIQLKRQGIELDKSELVNSLLGAWVAWQQSKHDSFPTDEVLPQDGRCVTPADGAPPDSA